MSGRAIAVRVLAVLRVALVFPLIPLLAGCAGVAMSVTATHDGDATAQSHEWALTHPGLPAAETEGTIPMQIMELTVAGPARGMDPGLPNRLGSSDVPVRWYEPEMQAWGTLVWAHGGSFVRGTLDWPEADWVSRAFAEAGLRVYSVDYILASERVKAPAPSNDVAAVLTWVAEEHEGPLFVGGASAGGHLAVLAALAHVERSGDIPSRIIDGLILQYPTLHRTQREDPALADLTADVPEQRRFDAARIAQMYAFYLGDDPSDALVAGELSPSSLAALPPTIIVNAEFDDLRASGEQFAEQLREVGVSVAVHTQPGTVHGYVNRPEETVRARHDADASIDYFVRQLREILH